MKNINSLLILLLFNCSSLFSQTQIDSVNYTFGDTLTFQIVSENFQDLSSLDLGVPGGGQTWDFSSQIPDSNYKVYIIDPYQSFAPDSFPSADVVMRQEEPWEGGVLVEFEQYFSISGSKLEIIGDAVRDEEGDIEVGDEEAGHIELFFPASLNSNWESLGGGNSYAYEVGFVIDSIMVDSVRISTEFTDKSVVDAWGNLILPKGDFDVIRIKNTITYGYDQMALYDGSWQPLTPAMKDIFGDNDDPETYISYRFWTNNVACGIYLASIILDDSTGFAEELEFQDILPNDDSPLNLSDISRIAPVSVFPNPTSDHLKILSEDNKIMRSYKVLDLQAKVILNGEINSSSFMIDLTSVPNGQYLIQVMDDLGVTSEMKKFNVSR